jgi:hypothetical protein
MPRSKNPILFTLEEVEALCQQAATREREEIEWELRVALARAYALAEESQHLCRSLGRLADAAFAGEAFPDGVTIWVGPAAQA